MTSIPLPVVFDPFVVTPGGAMSVDYAQVSIGGPHEPRS